jgi:hypothetical protein
MPKEQGVCYSTCIMKELDYFLSILSTQNLSEENIIIVNGLISHLLHMYAEPNVVITV